MGHVGHVDRRLPLDDTAGIAWPRTLVALDHVHAGDDDAGFRRNHPENLALRPFVAPRENDDAIALPDQIGRASCRERVCKSGYISVVDVHLTKKKNKTTQKK